MDRDKISDLDKAFDSAIDHYEEFKKLGLDTNEKKESKPTPIVKPSKKPKNKSKKLPVLNTKVYDEFDGVYDDYCDDFDEDYDVDYDFDYDDKKDEKDMSKKTTLE